MSRAAKCDKCGKFYERDVQVTEDIPDDECKVLEVGITLYAFQEGSSNYFNYDLCPDCGSKVIEWMDEDDSDADFHHERA